DSIACCSASALITVASMPIWSAVARLIPCSLICAPRRMFPPPTTIAISTPSEWTAFTSRATQSTASVWIPEPPGGQNPSPESLRRIRRKRTGRGARGEGAGLLFTDLISREPLHHDVLADLGDQLLHDLLHRLRLLVHPRLLEEAAVGVELLEPTLDDLRPRR